MNHNQVNFLISTLFIVVIILCIFLTRFYFDITKNTENRTRDNQIESVVKTFGNMQVFRSVNGGYGLLNQEHSVVIEPEWLEILDVTPDLAIVSGRMHGEILVGGVDYEENMVIPFVFSSLEKLGDGYHLGTLRADGRCVIYDKDYSPVFQESFEGISYYNKLLTARTAEGSYLYDMSGDVPVLRSAELTCELFGSVLNWKISNQYYLENLSAGDLKVINQHVQTYLDMLEQQDFSGLDGISGEEYTGNLMKQQLPADVIPGEISQFWFSQRKSGAYDFAVRMDYQKDPESQESQISQTGQAEIHCYFRKNTENKMILTAADLQCYDDPEPDPEPVSEPESESKSELESQQDADPADAEE